MTSWLPEGRYRLDAGILTVKRVELPGQRNGGSMVGGPSRGTVHTTETKAFHATSSGSYYHAQIRDYGDGNIELRQFIPFNVAARSLQNRPGGGQTNRQGDRHPQLAIIGYAKDSKDLSVPLLDSVAWFMRLCEDRFGIRRRAIAPVGGGGECYGVNSPCRMALAEWLVWSGWHAHQNVIENTHWDAGKILFRYLINYGAQNIVPIPDEEDEQVLQRGDNGEAVAIIQRGAIENYGADLGDFDPYAPGYPPGADGDFGASTETFVREQQETWEIEATGIVDGLTAAMILEDRNAVPMKLETQTVRVVKSVRQVPVTADTAGGNG